MSAGEPTREMDDPQTPMELRTALRSARDAGPSAEHLARLREATLQRLAGGLATGAAVGASVTQSGAAVGAGTRLPTTPGWMGIGKLLLAGTLAGAGVIAWLWQSQLDGERTPAAHQVPAATEAAPSAPPAPLPTPVAAAEARRTTAAAAKPPPAPPSRPGTETRAVAPEPAAASAATEEVPTSSTRARRRRARPTRREASGSAPLGLADEIELLSRARRALQDRPTETQRLTDAHARLFPRGRFVQEREVLAVHALLRRGARDEAIVRGRHFLETYPDSTHARRVAALLEEAEP